jgi:hypothetical protein
VAAVLVSSFAAELALSLGCGVLATDATGRRLWLVGQLAPLAIALGIAARWMRARRARALLARDVVELSSSHELDTVAELLARALGDPTLEVGYAVATSVALVDVDGNLLAPIPAPGRTKTVLHRGAGEPVAVLRHRADRSNRIAAPGYVVLSRRQQLVPVLGDRGRAGAVRLDQLDEPWRTGPACAVRRRCRRRSGHRWC